MTGLPIGEQYPKCVSATARGHTGEILQGAMLSYLRVAADEHAIAKVIVAVEEASDSTVLSWPAVFRHREGLAEDYLPRSLPSFRVMVIDTQPEATVNTTAMQRARYTPAQLCHFAELIAMLRHAMHERCPRTLGLVATESALINEAYLPKPHCRSLLDAVLDSGGFGVSAAHSGTVLSALLPADFDRRAETHLRVFVERLQLRVLTSYRLKAPLYAQAA